MDEHRVRVMHLLNSFEVGGAECVALNLATEMNRGGFEMFVCSLSGPGPMAERFEAGGIPTRLLPAQGGKMARIVRLARLLRRERVDILHCHNAMPTICGALAGKLAGVKAVSTRHSMTDVHTRGQRRIVEKALKPLVSRYVGVSVGVLEDAVAAGRMPFTNSSVVFNGVDTRRFRPAPHLSDNGGEVVVGCVARLSEEKRHNDLLEAVMTLARQEPNVRLDIVGDGAERASLEAQATRLGLRDRVRFLGNRDDVPSLLQGFDIFVLASRHEGLPLTILEAMATGLPVVATDVGSVAEVVRDGETGFLVPAERPDRLAEALDWLVKDAALRRRMGEVGRIRVENEFSLAVAAEKHAALYLEILRRKARGVAALGDV